MGRRAGSCSRAPAWSAPRRRPPRCWRRAARRAGRRAPPPRTPRGTSRRRQRGRSGSSNTSPRSCTTRGANAMSAGSPVLSYNAAGVVSKSGVPDIGCNRLAYVGQALFTSGPPPGEPIQSLTTPGEVAVLLEHPGAGNIQPRLDGANSILSPLGYKVAEITTTTVPATILANEKAYLLGPED